MSSCIRALWGPLLLLLLLTSDAATAAEPKAAASLPLRWARHAASPLAATTPLALADLYEHCGPADAGLLKVARQLAKQVAHGQRAESGRELAERVRAAGVPHLGTRAWALHGQHQRHEIVARLKRWLGPRSVARRCGIVRRGRGDAAVVALVTARALSDLEPFPLATEAYRWQQFEARVHIPLSDAAVVLLGPHGEPHRVPTSLQNGRVRSRFRLHRPGRWLVQLVGYGAGGPKPLLSLQVHVDEAPPQRLSQAPQMPRNPAQLLARINRERKLAGRLPLQQHHELARLATAHATAMARRGVVSHDVGDGTPDVRAAAAWLDGARVGENVAGASTLGGLWQAWWDSPSHRENLLDRRYREAGLAVVQDERGRYFGALMLQR